MSKEHYKYIDGTGYFDGEYVLSREREIERLNNIIKQQNTRNSRQRIANRKLLERNQDLVIENLKLNNIINELDRRLKSDIKTLEINKDCDMKVQTTIDAFQFYIDTIIQLKGSDKE